jgi:peroxiredoxin Q/BCP
VKFKIIIGLLIAGFIGLVVYSQATTPPKVDLTKDVYAKLIGKPAPDFTVADNFVLKISLKSLKGKKVVLFFNEGITCYPACWNQIAALGKDSELNNDQVTTLSIVPNRADDWDSAFTKQPELATETILYDTDLKMSKAYGVTELESSMHKDFQPGHTYIILDTDGVVRYTYDDPTMGIQNDKLKKELDKI